MTVASAVKRVSWDLGRAGSAKEVLAGREVESSVYEVDQATIDPSNVELCSLRGFHKLAGPSFLRQRGRLFP